MSVKRQYWSKMNHDEARHAIELMSDDEAGRWLRGWLAGAGGNEASEDFLMSRPMEWRGGYCAGKSSFADALEYSQKQSDRVSKRYTKATTVTSGSDPVDEMTTETLPRNTNNKTTNNEQLTEQETTQTKQREQQARAHLFSPPSESEWVDYCTTTWPDWNPVCAAESWAYYQGVGWMAGKAKIRDWKATARTAHGNARSWGKLQPTIQQQQNQQIKPKSRPLTLEEALVGVSPVRWDGKTMPSWE